MNEHYPPTFSFVPVKPHPELGHPSSLYIGKPSGADYELFEHKKVQSIALRLALIPSDTVSLDERLFMLRFITAVAKVSL